MNLRLFHSLEGEHICFKPLSINDAQAIHHYVSDEAVSRFIGWNLMKTLNQTGEFIELMLKCESAGTHLYASIVLKSTQAVIGTAMMFNFDRQANQAEIGYVLNRAHWGKGYGSESVALMSDFAFETLKLHKLYANVVDTNIGSVRILEKNGFKLEERLKDHYFIENKDYDALVFAKDMT